MAEAPSILVIGPSWVGDMVMAQCLFSALKQRWPDAAIDVMAPAWAGPLVRRMPEVRARLETPFQRRKLGLAERWRIGRALAGRYDRAYVMPGSWKSALVPFFARIPVRVGHLREMRYGLLNTIVPLPEETKRRTAHAFFALAEGGTFAPPRLSVDGANQAALLAGFGLSGQRYATLMPGAEFGPAKRWPAERYAQLARELSTRGLTIVLLGSPNEAGTTADIARLVDGAIDLAGKTMLEDAIDLIAGAELAVCNDSGLMHVAAAVGTPLVAVYGSTSPANTPPLSPRAETVWLGIDCSPCHKRICPLGHMNCLELLDAGKVLAAVDRVMVPVGS